MNYLEAKGWLTETERRALHHYASFAGEGGTIVNIGVEYGASMWCLYEGIQADDVVIFGIDIDTSKFDGGLEAMRGGMFLVEVDSQVMWEAWPKLVDEWIAEDFPISQQIDVLFIDGDHSYEGVKRDINWIQYVPVGGAVLFHDCYEWPQDGTPGAVRQLCPGVNKAVQEWVDQTMGWVEDPYQDSIRIFRRIK